MNDYELRSLTPKDMDAEENSEPEAEYEQKSGVYIEATVNPSGRSFRVTLDDKVLERVVVN